MSHKEQTTESLIRKMAEEPPILKHEWNRFLILAPIFITVILLYLITFHPFTNRWIHLPNLFPDFLWISCVSFYSLWILSRLRFPEESFSKSVHFPLIFASFWILYSVCMFGWDLIVEEKIQTHIGKCWIVLSVINLLFIGYGILILRTGKPGNPILAAAILSIFSLAFANFFLKFFCIDQSSFHILFSHVFTSLTLFLFSFFIFKNILKW
ncbi:NrsF family protein [Leptospira noguchii]|uniref:NrsF family protein n=1 Tax=Leptospira noguchii TaxID=28182 RepID=UPI001F05FEF6|nr:NrsF family protein [Leptospira noguchii]MCH1910842.1 NrsF family protein [Leptospira noguchii]MCH1917020.1 NrsF family protein [Leptospira noguchii]UOG62771.1 NrsF family protein [Leptospira noguchii]